MLIHVRGKVLQFSPFLDCNWAACQYASNRITSSWSEMAEIQHLFLFALKNDLRKNCKHLACFWHQENAFWNKNMKTMEEEKQTPHITNVFFKFVTKVLTSVVRDRHQVIQLASWDTPHHPLGLSPKNDGKNNATEPWDPEPMGKGFEERIIACHKKPWLKTIISTISIHPSATCSSYQNWSSFARCDSFYSLYSPHIPTQILVKQGRFWDERSAGKAKKFTGNQRLHDCLRLWQLDLVAQWQREIKHPV